MDTRWKTTVTVGALCLAGLQPAPAEEVREEKADRPRIGLALSGGGARGAAHVGVLKMLEELRIPVDYIAGTSMGSIIGGLYASGLSPDQIEEAIHAMDWDHIFSDKPDRVDRPFRRKRDDDFYLVKARPGFSGGEVKLPSGAIQGQKFDLALRQLVLSASTVSDFDMLPIPYRAVASDIGTGQAVVLAGGDLAMAMRASMAVPGAFAATEIDGRLLVDGGITNNLPVNVVRDMGADIVIAVDISTPLAAPEAVRNVLQITSQLTSIMTRANAEVQIASLKDSDILIVPELGDIGSGDFKLASKAVAIGYEAASAEHERLVRLRLLAADFRAHLSTRGRPQPGLPVIEFIRIVNNSRVADDMIRRRIHQGVGEPLDISTLEANIAAIYGLELFETVHYDLVEESGQTGVEITANERSWGPDYLQFGIELSNDFSGDNRYNLGIAYIRTAINRLNGELRFGLQVGEEPTAGADWYQPLDYASRYFVESRARFGRQNVNVFDAAGALRAQYRVTSKGFELSAGRNLGVLAEARLGYRRFGGDIEVRVGAPALPEGDFDSGAVFGRFAVDSLDNAYFPSHGVKATAEYVMFRDALGNDGDLDQLKSQLSWFTTMGNHTIGLGGRYNSTLSGDAAVQDRFRMGGFLNLSGYPQDALSGQHSAMVAAMFYRRSTRLPILPWYVGGSLELGNTWESRDDLSVDSAILSGSLFLGLDTPVGPLYLGYGHAEGGANAAFMYLGKIF